MYSKLALLTDPPDPGGGWYVVFWNDAGLAWNGSSYVTYTTSRDTFDVPAAADGSVGRKIVTIPVNLPVGWTHYAWYNEAVIGARSHTNDILKYEDADHSHGGGMFGSEVMSSASLSADAIERINRSATAIVLGEAAAGGTTTIILPASLNPAPNSDDQFKGRIVLFDMNTITQSLRGQGARIITSSVTGAIEVTEMTAPPVTGDTFTIT